MDGRLCLLVRICRQTLLYRQGAVLLSVCLRHFSNIYFHDWHLSLCNLMWLKVNS